MGVLLVVGEGEHAVEWQHALAVSLPGERIATPGSGYDPASIDVAIVAAPPPGALRGLPNLRLIQSLWAGIEGLLADATLPDTVMLARLVDPALTASMVESVLLHVLSLHRQAPLYRAQQAIGLWRPLPQKPASTRPVGILGLGTLGSAAAAALTGLGFPVTGWSRSARPSPNLPCLFGADGLATLAAGSDILVNLLPLTASTTGILCASLFDRLTPGAALVNLGRGPSLVEADLLAALDAGRLSHAVLDVLCIEPAPPAHPFWSHPGITLTPHVAAPTDRASAARIAAAAVSAWRAGRPVANLVDRGRGY